MHQWDQRLMKTLHLPAQYLWFDTVEWLVFLIPLIFGLLGNSILFLLMPILPYVIFPFMRKQRRGFVMHLKLTFGLGQLYGYPPNIFAKFEE